MKWGTRLKRVKRVDSDRLKVSLEYVDGFVGTVDLGFLFRNAARKPLLAEILRGQLFGKCFIESGALAWPNGYELCPDAIRAWILEQRARSAA